MFHKKNYIIASFLLFSLAYMLKAQPIASSGEEIIQSIEERKKLAHTSLLKRYPARNIGPVVQGARVTDLAVDVADPKNFYVAYASGGVFKTNNNGLTFEPVFDNVGALTIGDIALAPSDPDVLYVGTGEKNSSRSSYAGSGLYKSIDAGESWSHLGLDNTQHIARIVVHPDNPDMVWVAAMGALYSNNKERGVFRSTDGGKTWEKTLYINDSTGAIDLVINPQNPKQLWAATWERSRKAWDFKENGQGSAVYRSEDGGETWIKSTKGMPEGNSRGRIGLAISTSKPDILYAILDNQGEIDKEAEATGDELTFKSFLTMDKAVFLNLEDEKLGRFLEDNDFPEKYTPESVKKEVEEGQYEVKAIANYLGDANTALFNTRVIGSEVYRSVDAGETWEKMNSYELDGVYFTYGYYFGEIRVSPKNPDKIYIMGVPLLMSDDGGRSFVRLDTIGDVHVDHQAMWINPHDPAHIILGNDGGVYFSYDAGGNWRHINNTAVGQFYTVNVDMEAPYNVYGGLQDNGTLTGSSQSVPNKTKKWEKLYGGDGMFVIPDPRNSNFVYVGYQFGHYFRLDRAQRKTEYITPKHDIGTSPYRFNWRTPLMMSRHNPDIMYIGAERLFRSLDQGRSWEVISGDLTKNRPQGNVPYSTITCIAESSLKFGLLYVGTDDGNLQVSKDAGASWELISGGLPANKWISSVFASPHDLATVFVSLTGYRDDDFRTYIYKSEDYGSTWTSLRGNLPNEAANVLIQDPRSPNLLYLGTDYAMYISTNGGFQWEHVGAIPNVASYDMLVHPVDNELVVATHGRSIYVMDVMPLQKLSHKKTRDGLLAFLPEDIIFSAAWGEKKYAYMSPLAPEAQIIYYVGSDTDKVDVAIYNEANELLREMKADNIKGFHILNWDLKVMKKENKKRKNQGNMEYVSKGSYKIKFTDGEDHAEVMIEVK